MCKTTLTTLLGLALACTLVLAAPLPVAAASPDVAFTDAASWSPLALWQDLQDWWVGLVATPDQDVKRGVDMDPDGAPTTTSETDDFPTTERGVVIDPDGAP